MRLAKRDAEGKFDKEIQELCPNLSMQIVHRQGARDHADKNQYTIMLTNGTKDMTIQYNCGTLIDKEPTLTDVVWMLIREASILDDCLDADDFIISFGLGTDLANIRKAEQVYRDLIEQTKKMYTLLLPISQLQVLLQDY